MMSKDNFLPAWWLPNAHFQTIWGAFAKRKINLPVERERLELIDGDFLDLDWVGKAQQGPMIIILHGLGGSIHSPYVRGIAQNLVQVGWRVVVMHFRGCSGEPNRLARAYHSGETGDLNTVITCLKQREPQTPLAVVAYSLGANVLLKYLGETPENNPLSAAVAVSVPFVLQKAADHMLQGLARFYQWWLLRDLRQTFKEKIARMQLPLTLKDAHTFWQFDEQITAPLHGFASAKEYYEMSSCRAYLSAIATPTLILQALDDPLLPASVIPTAEELSPTIMLEVSPQGGHVGFITGRWPWRAEYWLEKRINCYLQSQLGRFIKQPALKQEYGLALSLEISFFYDRLAIIL